MSETKEKYKQFCATNPFVTMFLSYDWYNAMFDDAEWEVVIVEKNDNILGFLPYQIFKKKTFTMILPPVLTPYQGVWINYPEEQKYTNRLSFEKEVVSDIVAQYQKLILFNKNFYLSLPIGCLFIGAILNKLLAILIL